MSPSRGCNSERSNHRRVKGVTILAKESPGVQVLFFPCSECQPVPGRAPGDLPCHTLRAIGLEEHGMGGRGTGP